MPTFNGSITTTGKSEAIRLDKALFRLHPEFRQRAKVRAQIISPGHALIAVVDEEATPTEDEDPVVTAFLAFIEKDLKDRPGRRTRLSKTSLARAVRLTKGVKVGDHERLPEDVTL
jgi:antitoxin PrlF